MICVFAVCNSNNHVISISQYKLFLCILKILMELIIFEVENVRNFQIYTMYIFSILKIHHDKCRIYDCYYKTTCILVWFFSQHVSISGFSLSARIQVMTFRFSSTAEQTATIILIPCGGSSVAVTGRTAGAV